MSRCPCLFPPLFVVLKFVSLLVSWTNGLENLGARNFGDDDAAAVDLVRSRLASASFDREYGVVMVSSLPDTSYAVHSVPIWRAYCERHGLDFFHQQQNLRKDGARFEWTKPRLLIEILKKASSWKYIWIVDPASLPVAFGKKFTYAIKKHMRHKRHPSDKVEERVLWCPLDCDESQKESRSGSGSCYGPELSGCILAGDGAKESTDALRLVEKWYAMRDDHGQTARGLSTALDKVRQANYAKVEFRDVQQEMGKSKSKVLATFTFDDKFKHDTAGAIAHAIGAHKALRDAANAQRRSYGEWRPEL